MDARNFRCCLALLLLVGACSSPPRRDAYVPSVTPAAPGSMSREARIARAKGLEFPTEYVPPPGNPLSHHAAGLANTTCSAVFVTGLDPDFAVENVGYVTPFEVRQQLGKPSVDATRKTVQVATPGGNVRASVFLNSKQGCVTFAKGESLLHFTPKSPGNAASAAGTVPWPMGDGVAEQALPRELDAAKVQQALDAAFEPSSLTAAYLVTWRGRIIAERYAPGIAPQTPLESWSMGKTVLAALMGVLVGDGTYDLWQRAPIPAWERAADAHGDIRIADLLRMSSGLRSRGTLDAEQYNDDVYPDNLYLYTGGVDVSRYAYSRPMQWPPGTVGRYRNMDAVLIAYLIRRAAERRGDDFYTFADRALYDKLGVRTMIIEPDPYGNPLAHGYVLASARDWARIGNLLLQNGAWNGEQLLPKDYVRFMRTPAPAWVADGRPWYGGFVWLNRADLWPAPEDSYALAGAGGQRTVIVPTHDLVIVRMGHMRGEEAAEASTARAMKLLLEAVPQSRAVEPAYPARP